MDGRDPNPTHLRGRRHPKLVAAILLGLTVLVGSAQGQLFERATLIRGARLLTMDGPEIESGEILIKGGRIQDIGAKVELPFADRLTAKTVDATGKTITPGLIDAWGGLGRSGVARQPDATATSWDAFNSYATDDFLEAARNGVTTLFLAPAGVAGIKGIAAVVRLAATEHGGFGKPLVAESALCVDLGSGQTAVARMKTYQDVRRKFQAAVEYRKSLEDYEEDLKEYIEKLEERKKKDDKDKADQPGGEKGVDKPKDDKPAEQPRPEEKEPKGGLGAGLDFAKKEEAPAGGDKKKGGDEKKKEDELKKPAKPKFDPTGEVLLRAVDHKLVVRITAHRSADILNALALADEYNLDVLLEGATDAYLVTDELAAAKTPVVLGQTVRTGVYEPNEFRRHVKDNAARLGAAAVAYAVGTGGDPTATRFLAVNAQLAHSGMPLSANGENVGAQGWLKTVTADAADLLGLARAGRLRKGALADLVIWDGDPGDPASRVEQVLIGGEPVYPPSR